MKRNSLALAVLAIAAVSGAQSFSDGFEGAVFSNGAATGNGSGDTVTSAITWTAINNSTDVGNAITGWFKGNPDVFPAHGGTDYIGANFNNTTGIGQIDNWLMSDVRTFNNGDTISFWTRTSDTPIFADRLYLRLSTNGSSTAFGDFSNYLVRVNDDLIGSAYPNVWTQFTATITGLSAPTSGRFAFNYNVPNGGPGGSNSDYIGIDDVQYSAVPEPASMAVLGLGALALIRKRRAKK